MPFSKFQEVEKIFSSEGIYKIYVRELQESKITPKIKYILALVGL